MQHAAVILHVKETKLDHKLTYENSLSTTGLGMPIISEHYEYGHLIGSIIIICIFRYLHI